MRSTPLIRTPRTLPRILDSADAAALLAAARTDRDRAMLLAMLLGGLRRCEVLGLRLADIDLADRKVTITEGKGGHHRIVPVAPGFFSALTAYLDTRAARGNNLQQRVCRAEGSPARPTAVPGRSRRDRQRRPRPRRPATG